ncbi:MAG: hypothetical protein AAF901_13055 [Bacteroidota bacterium]
MPTHWPCPKGGFSKLEELLQDQKIKDWKQDFPYSRYLKAGDYCNLSSIIEDLDYLNTVDSTDKMEILGIMVTGLTQELEKKIAPSFQTYNPDSLIQLLHWATKFGNYGNFDSEYQLLYDALHTYWLNYIVNKLGVYAKEDDNLKFNYQFNRVFRT